MKPISTSNIHVISFDSAKWSFLSRPYIKQFGLFVGSNNFDSTILTTAIAISESHRRPFQIRLDVTDRVIIYYIRQNQRHSATSDNIILFYSEYSWIRSIQ